MPHELRKEEEKKIRLSQEKLSRPSKALEPTSQRRRRLAITA
jgi:hypothetical protein